MTRKLSKKEELDLTMWLLSQAVEEAKALQPEVEKLEREIDNFWTSEEGMHLCSLQHQLKELKPQYERNLQQAGRAFMQMSRLNSAPEEVKTIKKASGKSRRK